MLIAMTGTRIVKGENIVNAYGKKGVQHTIGYVQSAGYLKGVAFLDKFTIIATMIVNE